MLERSEYETLTTVAKKYITQEKKASKLQKALDTANKVIAELKAKVETLTNERFQYKSVRKILNPNETERENERLRRKVQSYESVIERNHLWALFDRNRAKTAMRDDAR